MAARRLIKPDGPDFPGPTSLQEIILLISAVGALLRL